MRKTLIDKKISWIMYKPCDAKYLVVVVSRGMTSEFHNFRSFKDAKRAFGEIAHDHGYKPSEINSSDYYDVSIWE